MEIKQAHPFQLGVIAEIHRAPSGTPRVSWHNEMLLDRSDELLELALEQLVAQRVDALVLLGDLTNRADDASFAIVGDRARQRGLPTLAVPGNHDAADEHALARFADHLQGHNIRAAPASLFLGDKGTIILVSIARDAHTGTLRSANIPDLTPLAGQTLVFLTHYPLLAMQPRLAEAGLKHSGDLSDRQEIADRLFNHDGPVIVIHGHLHVRAIAVERNVLHLSCAALVEPPHEVTVVSIAMSDRGGPVVRSRAMSIMTSDVAHLPVLDDAEQVRRFQDGT
jgi:predicted phosphodiesterase